MSSNFFSDAGRNSTSPSADPYLDKTLAAWSVLDGRQVEILHGVLFEKDYHIKNFPHIAFKADQIFHSVISAYVATYKRYLGDETSAELDEFCTRRELSYGFYIKGSATTRTYQHKTLDAKADLDTRLSFSSLPYADTYIIAKNEVFYREMAERSLILLFQFYAPGVELPKDLRTLLETCLVFQNNSLFLMTLGKIDIVFPIPIPKNGLEIQEHAYFVHENTHIKVPTQNGWIDRGASFQFGSPVEFSTLQQIFSSKTIVVENPHLMSYNGFERLAYSISKGWTILDIPNASCLLYGAFARAQENSVLIQRAILEQNPRDIQKVASIRGGLLEKLYLLIDKKECSLQFALNIFINAYRVCKILAEDGDSRASAMIPIFNECFRSLEWRSKFPSFIEIFFLYDDGLDLLIEVKTLHNHLSYFPSNRIFGHLGRSCRVAGSDGAEYGYFISAALSLSKIKESWCCLESKLGRQQLTYFFQNSFDVETVLDSPDGFLKILMKRAFHQEYLSEEELREVFEFLPEFIDSWSLDAYFVQDRWRKCVEDFFSAHPEGFPGSSDSKLFLQMIVENPAFFKLFPMFYQVFFSPSHEKIVFQERFLKADCSERTSIKNCLMDHGKTLEQSLYFEFLKIIIQNSFDLFVEEDFKAIYEVLLELLKLNQSLKFKQDCLAFILEFIESPKRDSSLKAFNILLELINDDTILLEVIQKDVISKLSVEYLKKLVLLSIEKTSPILFEVFLNGRQQFLEPLDPFLKLKQLTQSTFLKTRSDCFIEWSIQAYKSQMSQSVHCMVFPVLKELSEAQIVEFAMRLLKEEGSFVEKWIVEVSRTTFGLNSLKSVHSEIKAFVASLKKKSIEITPDGYVSYTKILLAAIKDSGYLETEVRYAVFLLQNLIEVDLSLFTQGIKEFFPSLIQTRKRGEIRDIEGYKTICRASLQMSSQREGVASFHAQWIRECQESVLQDRTFDEMLELAKTYSNSKPFKDEFEERLKSLSRLLTEAEILIATQILGESLASLKTLLAIAKKSSVSQAIRQDLYLKIFELSLPFGDKLKVLGHYLKTEIDQSLCLEMINRLTAYPKKTGFDKSLMSDVIERIATSVVDIEILKFMELVLQLPDFKTAYLSLFLKLFLKCQSREKFNFLYNIVEHLERFSKEEQEILVLQPLYKLEGEIVPYCLFDYLCEGPFDARVFETVYQLSTKNGLDELAWNRCYTKFIDAYLLNLQLETSPLSTSLKEARFKVFQDYIRSLSTVHDDSYFEIIERTIANTGLFLQLSDFLMLFMAQHKHRFNQKIYLQYLEKRSELKLRVKDRDSAEKVNLEIIFSVVLGRKEDMPPIRKLVELYETVGGVYKTLSSVALGHICVQAFTKKNAEDIAFVFEFINTLIRFNLPESVKKAFLMTFSKAISLSETTQELQEIFSQILELNEIIGPAKIATLVQEIVKKTRGLNSGSDLAYKKCFKEIRKYLNPIALKSGKKIELNFTPSDFQLFADHVLDEAALLPKFPLSFLTKKIALLPLAFSVSFYDLLAKKYFQKVLESIIFMVNDPDNLSVLEIIEKEFLVKRGDADKKLSLRIPVFALLIEMTKRSQLFNESLDISSEEASSAAAVGVPIQDTAIDQQRTLRCLLQLIKIQTILYKDVHEDGHEDQPDMGLIIWISLSEFIKPSSWQFYEGKAPLMAIETLSKFDEAFSKGVYLDRYINQISSVFINLMHYVEIERDNSKITQPLVHRLIKNIILKCSRNNISIYNQFFAILRIVESVEFSPQFTKEMFSKSLIEFGISYFSSLNKDLRLTEDFLSKPLAFVTDTQESQENYMFHFSSWILFLALERICDEVCPQDLKILSTLPTLFDCYFDRGFCATPGGLERWRECMGKIYFFTNQILDQAQVYPAIDKGINWIEILHQFICLPSKILIKSGVIGSEIALEIYTMQRELLFRICNRYVKGSIKDLDPTLITRGIEIESYADILLPLKMNPYTRIEPLYYKLEYFKILISMIMVMNRCELNDFEREKKNEIIRIATAYFGTMIYPSSGVSVPIPRWMEILFAFKLLVPFIQEKEDLRRLLRGLVPFVELAFQEKSFDLETLEVIFQSVLIADSEEINYVIVEMAKTHNKDFTMFPVFKEIVTKAPKSDPLSVSSRTLSMIMGIFSRAAAKES